ncbi:MAG: hypothetical protein ACI4BD_08735 [Paludibacteraceae bacterium]
MKTKRILLTVLAAVAVVGFNIGTAAADVRKEDATFVSQQHHVKYIYNPAFLKPEKLDKKESNAFLELENDDITLVLAAITQLQLDGISIYEPELKEVFRQIDLAFLEELKKGQKLMSFQLLSSCQQRQSNGIDFYRSEYDSSVLGLHYRNVMYYFFNHNEIQMVNIVIAEEYLKEHPDIEQQLIGNLYTVQ